MRISHDLDDLFSNSTQDISCFIVERENGSIDVFEKKKKRSGNGPRDGEFITYLCVYLVFDPFEEGNSSHESAHTLCHFYFGPVMMCDVIGRIYTPCSFRIRCVPAAPGTDERSKRHGVMCA